MEKKECKHCFHHKFTDNSEYPTVTYHRVCCHCGIEETETRNLYANSGKTYTMDESEHGIYKPITRVIY